MSATKVKKKRVRGRCKNVETMGRLYVIEMHEPTHDKVSGTMMQGFIAVRRKSTSKVEQISFDELVRGGVSFMFKVGGMDYTCVPADDGLRIRQKGFKKWVVTPWASLVPTPDQSASGEPESPDQFKMPFIAT